MNKVMNCGAKQRYGNIEHRRFQAKLQKTIEKYGLRENMVDMTGPSNLVQLKQADGSTEYNVKAQNDKPWHFKEKMHTAHFILPYGYSRYAFSLETQGKPGDIADAYWASDDPTDASIVLHVKTSRSLKANDGFTASVYNVFGKKKNNFYNLK